MNLIPVLLAEAGTPRDGLRALDYAAVGLYLLVTAGIVVWASFRQKNTEEFFLAGRRMPWLAVGMSLMATLLSTNSFLGLPGEVIKNGVTLIYGYLSIPLSMVVIMGLWVPFFMRLRMTSAYEYLESRFDCRVRLLAGFLFFLLRLGWISVVVYTASMALSRMIDVDIRWVIASVGIAATIFACVGGIDAVIWNDVLQFFMLFGGTGVTIGYVWWVTGQGPVGWWHNITSHFPNHTKPIAFSWDLTERITITTAIINNFFWEICTHGSDQVVLQRYFSTTSLKAARRSYLVNAISAAAMSLLLTLCGLALLSFYLQHADFLPADLSIKSKSDELLPYFFAHQLPVGFGGLILAGFLCDAMQTLESGVNSITAVATRDVFERLFPGGRKYLSSLVLARIVTVGMGLLVTGIAFGVEWFTRSSSINMIELMPKAFNLILGPLASLFFIGMFLPRCRGRSAILGGVTGLLVAIVWSWWPQLCLLMAENLPKGETLPLGDPKAVLEKTSEVVSHFTFQNLTHGGYWLELAKIKPTFTLTIALPCLTSLSVAGIWGLLFDGGDHPGRQYTWLAVMRRPAEPAAATTDG